MNNLKCFYEKDWKTYVFCIMKWYESDEFIFEYRQYNRKTKRYSKNRLVNVSNKDFDKWIKLFKEECKKLNII